jgi:type VI protein secretion system component VasF
MGGGGKFGLGRISSLGELLGYRSTWMVDTKETLESELHSRGIAHQGSPDRELSADTPKRAGRSIPWLTLLLLGILAVGITAWLFYKITLD